MDHIRACYDCASLLLARALEAAGRPVPSPIPLKLQEERGKLVSGLPRQEAARTGENPQALAQSLLADLNPEGVPFSQAEAVNGLILFTLSPRWYRQVLEDWALLPWPDLPPRPRSPRRQDEEDPVFLLTYTRNRCQALALRDGEEVRNPFPPALLCLLARGPEGTEQAVRAARLYWALPPCRRRDPLLAQGVGKLAGTGLKCCSESFRK